MWYRDHIPELYDIHKDLTISRPNMDNHAYYNRIMPIYKQLCDACSDLGDAVARQR